MGKLVSCNNCGRKILLLNHKYNKKEDKVYTVEPYKKWMLAYRGFLNHRKVKEGESKWRLVPGYVLHQCYNKKGA